MPAGSPDYGVLLQQINETEILDAGELAARLGSILGINRTGQVVFEINDGLIITNSYWSSSDGQGTFIPSLIYATFNRPNLWIITSGTNAASAGCYPQTTPFGSKQLGLQVFAVANTFTCTTELMLRSYINGIVYIAGIQVNLSNGTISYYNSLGGWTSIGTFKVPTLSGQALVIKFTVDFNTMKYKKLYFGNEQFADLSAYVPYSAASALMDQGIIVLQLTNLSAAGNGIFFTDAVVTINEV
jgi:hypothetical protein